MALYNNGYSAKYIGFWKDSMFHGYGKLSYSTGDMREGLFEYDNYRENRLDIKSYNPDQDKMARHCEFYNYYTLVKKIKKPFDQDVADEMNELLQ
jgi:hypothetical protein